MVVSKNKRKCASEILISNLHFYVERKILTWARPRELAADERCVVRSAGPFGFATNFDNLTLCKNYFYK
jgi:hypothetical protein